MKVKVIGDCLPEQYNKIYEVVSAYDEGETGWTYTVATPKGDYVFHDRDVIVVED